MVVPQAAPVVGLKSTERKMPSPPLRVPTFSDTTSMHEPVVLRTKIPAMPFAFVVTSTKLRSLLVFAPWPLVSYGGITRASGPIVGTEPWNA